MKAWLRLTLVTAEVGGGFTGVVITLQALLASRGQSPAYYVLMLAFIALFVFVTISGLAFVHNPNRTYMLIAALALQVPWVSSPLIAYKFAVGFQVCAAFIGGRYYGGFRLGSDFQINFFQRLPWGVGVNVFPLALLFLLIRTKQMPNPPLQPTAAAPRADRL